MADGPSYILFFQKLYQLSFMFFFKKPMQRRYISCQLNSQTDWHALHLREAILEPASEESKSPRFSCEVMQETDRRLFALTSNGGDSFIFSLDEEGFKPLWLQ
jgi:hypothetical protein